MIEIDPFNTRSVRVKFNCDDCGKFLISDEITVPSPDFNAETARDSYSENTDNLSCDCGKDFCIEVWASFVGGYVRIDNLFSRDGVDEFTVEETPLPPPYELDAILSNTDFFDTFLEEISNLERLNQLTLDDQALEKTLKRQLFVGTIACMETYLSDAFIVTTLSKEKYLKAFVKTFKDFKDRKIELRDIFDCHQKIKEIAKKEM